MDACFNVSYTNVIKKYVYIIGNTWTCTSCLNGVKIFLLEKLGKYIIIYIFFITYKFVRTCHDKNVICDSTIWKKKWEKKINMMKNNICLYQRALILIFQIVKVGFK
jgi:hypothetical protein